LTPLTKNGVKREKHPVCASPVGENALLMLEVRGEWAYWFKLHNRGMQQSICEATTHTTYNRRPHWVPLISTTNRKTTICKSSTKLDSWRLEKCCLVWWVL